MENPIPPSNSQPTQSNSSIFSTDPQTRDIELNFLQRLLAKKNSSIPGFLNAKQRKPDSFEKNLAAIQHPLFVWLAKELDKALPQDADFGRFRDAEIPPPDKP